MINPPVTQQFDLVKSVASTKASDDDLTFDRLIDAAANRNFRGYDPYDFAESKSGLPHQLLSKFSFLNKISPINFRPLLGIHPSDNSKANGLWLWAMVKTDKERYRHEIQYLLNWIERNVSTEFEEFSMGFAFKMALTRYASGPGKTSLIISLFIVLPLIELYVVSKDEAVLEQILSFEKLLETKWMKFETENELWYSYLPSQKDEVYNATAKVGRFYANLYKIRKQNRYLDIIEKIQNYLLRVQNADGHWIYSLKSPYVDNFHTAFVLESIYEMNQVIDKVKFGEMFEKGLKYYIKNCFTGKYKPLHFSTLHGTHDIRNKLLGTEIRDCANAIIFFSKIGHKKEATKIMDWTRENFYNEEQGYFSFFKNRLFKNNIYFIRWQAWMALAIAEYQQLSKNTSKAVNTL
jgi:hypothetical protein